MGELESYVVLPAGGIGERLGSKTPKQFLEVCGRPLICYSIESFMSISWISRIVIPVPGTWKEFSNKLKEKHGYSKVEFVDGKGSRHESIYVGLKALKCKDSDIVVIHDAVRPFLEENFLTEIVTAATKYGASGAVRPLVSTVIKCTSDNFMESSLVRRDYRESHTPQAFTYGLISNAYEVCSSDDFKNGTECLHLVQKYCDVAPKLIDGPEYLWKVTHTKDIALMEHYIRARKDDMEGRIHNNKRTNDSFNENGHLSKQTKSSNGAISVYIGGLSNKITKESLRDFLEQNSTIPMDVQIVNKSDNTSTGFAYAYFETDEDRKQCLKLSGKEFDGCKITCRSADLQTALSSAHRVRGNLSINQVSNNDFATKLLRVRNLSFKTDDDMLSAAFPGAKNVCIVKDDAGSSCGFGFVEYPNITSAIEGRDRMIGKYIDGHSIQIAFARAEESFSSGLEGDKIGRGRTTRALFSTSEANS